MTKLKGGLFSLIAVSLLGCLDASAAEPKATSWVLERGRDIPSRPSRMPRLHMDGQKLSGSTGCNSFTAAVVAKADKRVAIEQVALTRKLCAEKLDRVETAFVRSLEETAYLEQKGKRLTFLSAKRQPLLVWTRNHKSAAQRPVHRKRHAGVRHHRRSVSLGPQGMLGLVDRCSSKAGKGILTA